MKQITFLINCPQEYLSRTDLDTESCEANRFFMTISEVFLPLLEMFCRLESENIPYKMSLVLPSATLTMLEDAYVQSQFLEYLDRRLEFGKKCLNLCTDKTRPALEKQIEGVKETKKLFEVKYNKQLLPAFDRYRRSGNVEVLATCATNIFLPHYIDLKETVSAQVETGLYAYKTFFQDAADGFFLPEMGYAAGLDQILRSYGVKYTVLDGRAVLFSEDTAPCGVFSPVMCTPALPSSLPLAVFPRDNRAGNMFFGDAGYASCGEYCDTEKDLSFSTPLERLSPFIPKGSARFPSLYRLINRGGTAYSENVAHGCAVKDAEHFLKSTKALFEKAQCALPSVPLSLTFVVNSECFINRWHEGIDFIECVFREQLDTLAFASFKDVMKNCKCLPSIRPYFSAAFDTGYGECLINGANSWMLPPVRRASERMTLLAERFYDGGTLKSRLLNLGAKELLLCQSSTWQKRLGDLGQDSYAMKRFLDSLKAFNTVFEDLGSNSFTPSWLTALEAEYPIFPWINYKIFCKKR